jgi:hypothetical protein
MLNFITDICHNNEPDILAPVKHKPLLIVSIDGQLLGRYEAPKEGWTHKLLCELNAIFPKEWRFCGADALLGEQWIGSTEV